MKKKHLNILLLAALIAVPSLFNSCGNGRFESIGNGVSSASSTGGGGGGSTAAAIAKCDSARQRAFTNTGYHAYLKNKCGACHIPGGQGSGSFASPNVPTAFSQFIAKTDAKVFEKATSSTIHISNTFAGPAFIPEWNVFRPNYLAAEAAHAACLAEVGTTVSTGVPKPTKFTVAKPVTIAALNAPQTLTWNTETEMSVGGDRFTGGTITLTVTAINDIGNGTFQYAFSNPRFINANTTGAAHIQGIGIKLNGTAIPDGTTFYTLDRLVPNVTDNNSRALTYAAGGAALFVGPSNTAMNIAVGFGKLEVYATPFNPLVYTQINTNIFAPKCNSCHGTQGGLALNTYAAAVNKSGNSGLIAVTKWNLEDSELWNQVDMGFMPTAGPLTQAEKDQVRDWILDGAPNTAADVRR